MAAPDSSELEREPDGRTARGLSSEMQALFLDRLRRLLERRYDGSKLDLEQQRLLDRAIYSTFCDCVELGMSEPARSLLRQHQAS
jgi:hypothetical protein